MKIDSETTNPLVIDQYLYMDIVFSIAAGASQFLVQMLGIGWIKDEAKKDTIDYMLTTVMLIALLRFF